ncbi:MAG TPA: cellulase family glycosylhydrolase [Solirubrobacteraceae bacterium]|nr:cellulase family glycosylhydrolase [Solirubrobacteraceae bacterium]
MSAALLAALATAAPAQAAPGYVERSGTDLVLDGKRFGFVGANNYRLTSDSDAGYTCGTPIGDAQVGALLDQMRNAGATVVRTWFFQSYHQSTGWANFDRLLNAAAARGMKVIPVLVNNYADCEPSGGAKKDEGFYEYGFRQAGWGYSTSFKSYASAVAAHYASNKTIAFWQLVNEAETSYNDQQSCNATLVDDGTGTLRTRSSVILRSFADEMVGTVKAADPNHLVSLGTIGSGQCGASGAEYQYVHAGAVDMCEYHDYDHANQAIPGDQWNGLQLRIDQCNQLGKPMFEGEVGIVADVDANGGSAGGSTGGAITATTLQRRAGFFDAKLGAQIAGGVDGFMVWDKILESSSSTYNDTTGRYGIGPSDPSNEVLARRGDQIRGASVRSGFEDGTLGGWELAWGPGLALSSSTVVAFEGARSLRFSLTGAGYPAARVRTTTGAGPGTTISYHVYKPSGAPSSVTAKPYLSNGSWANTFGADVPLQTGWNTVFFTVPAGTSTPLQAIGLQINNGSGWTGSVYLDNVAW